MWDFATPYCCIHARDITKMSSWTWPTGRVEGSSGISDSLSPLMHAGMVLGIRIWTTHLPVAIEALLEVSYA